MTALSERQKAILKVVIDLHVKSAKPVSSRHLAEKNRFALSPATVRNELAQLEEEGYLLQPHTSAGRVPTEKAYRFYVAELAEGTKLAEPSPRRLKNELFSEEQNHRTVLKKSAKVLARHSGGLALAGLSDSEEIYQAGLTQLIAEPEFADFNVVFEMAGMLEDIHERLDKFFDSLVAKETETFIGRENPFGLEEFSMISRGCKVDGREGFLVIVGPTRMNYRKNISLVEQLGEFLDNLEG